MTCRVYEELLLEWKWLVAHDPGTRYGADSEAVILHWELVQHRATCSRFGATIANRSLLLSQKTAHSCIPVRFALRLSR